MQEIVTPFLQWTEMVQGPFCVPTRKRGAGVNRLVSAAAAGAAWGATLSVDLTGRLLKRPATSTAAREIRRTCIVNSPYYEEVPLPSLSVPTAPAPWHPPTSPDDLHEVARGVLGRQEAEARAGRAGDALDVALVVAVVAVDVDRRRLAGTHQLELRLLEARGHEARCRT